MSVDLNSYFISSGNCQLDIEARSFLHFSRTIYDPIITIACIIKIQIDFIGFHMGFIVKNNFLILS